MDPVVVLFPLFCWKLVTLFIHVLVVFVRRVGIYFHAYIFPQTFAESIG